MPPAIVIWADYSCPFCYVATERADWVQDRYGARVRWAPFDLHPEYPPEGLAIERLQARLGPDWRRSLERKVADAGLPLAPVARIPRTRDALIVAELARERGVFEALHRRLFAACWAQGRDIGDRATLVQEAEAAGLAADEVATALATGRYADVIERSTSVLRERPAAQGVPTWLVDDELVLSGVPTRDALVRGLRYLGHEPVAQ